MGCCRETRSPRHIGASRAGAYHRFALRDSVDDNVQERPDDESIHSKNKRDQDLHSSIMVDAWRESVIGAAETVPCCGHANPDKQVIPVRCHRRLRDTKGPGPPSMNSSGEAS